MFQFFQDELENMDESNDEYQYQKAYMTSQSLSTLVLPSSTHSKTYPNVKKVSGTPKENLNSSKKYPPVVVGLTFPKKNKMIS